MSSDDSLHDQHVASISRLSSPPQSGAKRMHKKYQQYEQFWGHEIYKDLQRYEHIHVSFLRCGRDHQQQDGRVMERRRGTSTWNSKVTRNFVRKGRRKEIRRLTWQVLDEDKFARAQMAC